MHRRQGNEVDRGRCGGFTCGYPSPSGRSVWGGWSQRKSQGGPGELGGAPRGAPCLGKRTYESRKAAILHSAAGAMKRKAERGASTDKDEIFVVSGEECRGMRCCRHNGSGRSAMAEPKLLNDMMGKSNTSKERQVQNHPKKGCCEWGALKPYKYTHVPIPFYPFFFRSFPSAMQSCEICVWQGTCLCKISAELVHPRSAVLTMIKVHTGSLSFHLPSKYSR